MMRPRKLTLAALATVCALLGPGRAAVASDYVYLMPDIGDYLWLVEAYMPTSYFGRYFATGALVEGDFFAGFADLDGDGSDELLVAVDHPTACDGDVCDLFTFALDPEGPDLYAPCNWLLADRSRTPIRRSLCHNESTPPASHRSTQRQNAAAPENGKSNSPSPAATYLASNPGAGDPWERGLYRGSRERRRVELAPSSRRTIG